MSSTSARADLSVLFGECGRLRADEMSTSLQYGPIARGVLEAAILVTAVPCAWASDDTLAAGA
jgi:hypothetical protein